MQVFMRVYFDAASGSMVEDSSPVLDEEPDYADETPDQHDKRIEHEAYREAASRLLPILWACIGFVRDARNSADCRFRIDLMGYIFGSPELSQLSEDVLGIRHNKTRAAVSAEIIKFQRQNQLTELLAQKRVESRKSYHRTRKEKLATA
jgi:hypothetical protein